MTADSVSQTGLFNFSEQVPPKSLPQVIYTHSQRDSDCAPAGGHIISGPDLLILLEVFDPSRRSLRDSDATSEGGLIIFWPDHLMSLEILHLS